MAKILAGDAALDALLVPLLELAAEAGRRIMQIYRGGFSIQLKEDRSPLTEADLAAHDAIAAGLAILTPELPQLSEEEASGHPFGERGHWQRYWLIDPLDGTREFIKRNDQFTVNIALIETHAPVLGVIHVPVSGVSYFARRGGGAFKQLPGEAPRPIHVRRLGGDPPVVAGSRSHRGERLTAFLRRLGEHRLLAVGSSLKSCLVAEGSADLYPRLGPTSEWDTAAAQCILEEAGGQLTDTEMRPLRYNTKASLLNPHFFAFGDQGRDWSKYLA